MALDVWSGNLRAGQQGVHEPLAEEEAAAEEDEDEDMRKRPAVHRQKEAASWVNQC